MWMQRWLGEIYSRLFYHYRLETFSFSDASRWLGIDSDKLMVAFSHLHKAGALTIFSRSRPRVYRLLDPYNYLLIASGHVRLIEIMQERYLNLIYNFFRSIADVYNLRAYSVYGSVARGTARDDSDVDLLIVSDDFSGSISSRLDELYEYVKAIEDEVRWLHNHDIHTTLSIYPLTSGEAEEIPILFLDIAYEAKIVYDDGFLERLLDIIMGKLSMMGARRIELEDGRWYWDLKPDYKPYDVIEI